MNHDYPDKHVGTIVVSGVIAVRLIAAPLFLYTFLSDLTTWTLGIFLIAVFTDALDGYVARRLVGSAFLGPYSDATADFVLVLAAFAAFVIRDIYPFWMLLLIVAVFIQFVLTSRLDRPVYDPVGKYYGVFLFVAIGVTLIWPHAMVCRAILVSILGFTVASAISRAMFLLGLLKKVTLGHNGPGL
jgi:phosphatidylglycerophosphate synthase